MPQPNRHRYKRKQRLIKAISWIKKYEGKKLHHGYAKYFGVSKLCAVIELEILGIKFAPNLKEEIIDIRVKRKKSKEVQEEFDFESDEYFAFIAGYTSGGAAYGITWQEWRRHTAEVTINNDDKDEIPF